MKMETLRTQGSIRLIGFSDASGLFCFEVTQPLANGRTGYRRSPCRATAESIFAETVAACDLAEA